MPNMLKIKDFGNDQPFDTVEQLRCALAADYRGKHVTIVYSKKPHGMHCPVLVSVSDSGDVFHSNREGVLVDFGAMQQNLHWT